MRGQWTVVTHLSKLQRCPVTYSFLPALIRNECREGQRQRLHSSLYDRAERFRNTLPDHLLALDCTRDTRCRSCPATVIHYTSTKTPIDAAQRLQHRLHILRFQFPRHGAASRSRVLTSVRTSHSSSVCRPGQQCEAPVCFCRKLST